MTNSRLAYIDGLRACAALLVLVTHTWAFAGAPALSFSIMGKTIVLATLPAVGYVGVNLFLVLSGFCLSWPFFTDARSASALTLTSFWARRVKRIVPAYFVSIALVFGLLAGVRGLASKGLWPVPVDQVAPVPALGEITPHLFFVQNLSVDHASTINGSYWSLALEFQLYLAFPLLAWAMLRWGPWRVLSVVLLLQVVYRIMLERSFPQAILAQFEFVLPKAVFGRMFDFVAGMAAAHVVARRRSSSPGQGWWMLSAGCLVTAFAMTYSRAASSTTLDVLWAIGFGALVVHGAGPSSRCGRLLCWGPLVKLGIMSYSLYLIHQPLVECISKAVLVHLRPGTAFFVCLGAAPMIIGLASVMFVLVERPFMNLFARRPGDKPREEGGKRAVLIGDTAAAAVT